MGCESAREFSKQFAGTGERDEKEIELRKHSPQRIHKRRGRIVLSVFFAQSVEKNMQESTSILTKNFSEKELALRELQIIPGVGKSIGNDLYNIGIRKPSDLRRKNPEKLYQLSNDRVGVLQDRCLLYVFRCAVYFAETPKPEKEKLNWWWWKDKI
jgi:hypothetical protein